MIVDQSVLNNPPDGFSDINNKTKTLSECHLIYEYGLLNIVSRKYRAMDKGLCGNVPNRAIISRSEGRQKAKVEALEQARENRVKLPAQSVDNHIKDLRKKWQDKSEQAGFNGKYNDFFMYCDNLLVSRGVRLKQ